ncbi:hypothetical protein [Paraliobacillus sp. X-1268]|uniref:hypothetical protein n=1 Tax=Paraliobacillus sp. X-1268 TaxID=2213193 RepID=UPI000E3DE470|nr:hypothetical protein [Paraliobacillus sp. X-1268]
MKKLVCLFLLLFLVACSNDETVESSTDQTEIINELEKTIEEQTKTLESKEQRIVELESMVAEETDDSKEVAENNETNGEVSTLALGETFSNEEIEVTIQKLEYVSGGVQAYFEVHNKSEEPLEKPGSLKFKLEESELEEEFNKLGYSMNFDDAGYLYEGEKRSGSYMYMYDRDITISEVSYHKSESGYTTDLIAKWNVK